MSDTPEQNIQADDAQAQAGGTDASAELLNKIQLLEANNRKLLGEKKNARHHQWRTCSVRSKICRTTSKRPNNHSWLNWGVQNPLAEATGTVSSLQDELAQLKASFRTRKSQFQQQQIKATAALNAFTQSECASEHLLKCSLAMSLNLR